MVFPQEIKWDLKASGLRWFIVSLYCLLFVVFFFSSSKNVTPTILAINALIILATIPILHKKELLEKLVHPLVLTRAVFIQILVQLSIYFYWGQYNLAAVNRLPLVFHQILFGYLFIFLLSFLSGKKFKISFSPAAAILSTNLFIWFSSPLYYTHYALIIIAMTAKTFITRNVDGVERHIFNPSGFVSNIAAVTISLMQYSFIHDNVYASQMGANFLWVPNFDTFVLLASCVTLWSPNMYLIPIACVVTMTAFELYSYKYFGKNFTTETPRGSILLGITLLITDPATAPRSKMGQLLYGIGYAFTIFISFIVIAFYSWQMYFIKVFFLIPLNFMAYHIDRVGMWIEAKITPRLNLKWELTRKRLLISYLLISSASSVLLAYRRAPPYLLDFAQKIQPPAYDLERSRRIYIHPGFWELINPTHAYFMVEEIIRTKNRPKGPFPAPSHINPEFDQFKPEYMRR